MCHDNKGLFEFLHTLMNQNFRIQGYCFSLDLSSLALASIFFSLFFVSSEWEYAALEHCCWCEEGYKRKTMQSDHMLMCQFMFSWADSSLESTDLGTALIVWGARSAWKCLIMMSALLMLCWCLLVLDYGFSNFLECRNSFQRTNYLQSIPLNSLSLFNL